MDEGPDEKHGGNATCRGDNTYMHAQNKATYTDVLKRLM